MSEDATFDLIAAGELLLDLISTDYADDFQSADTYRRMPGGSPANLASNLVRLGKRAALIAGVGNDDGGKLLIDYASGLGLDVSHVARFPQPTTLILVTKSKAVSDFEPYRGADAQIQLNDRQIEWATNCRLFHTTAFALSREPARSTILRTAKVAVEKGVQLSIDANYAPKIWPDRQDAINTIEQYLKRGALAKFSEVDYERLYDRPVDDPKIAGRHLLSLGAKLVCLTMGHEGVHVFYDDEYFHLPARKVEVKDTTGAGDAFWSGFLSAWLDDASPYDCAVNGRAMAERKVAVFGPLPARVVL